MPKISKPNRNYQKFWRPGKLNKISPCNKILLYYSTFLSTILIIGGFWTARSKEEIVSNLLFLPIVMFLWIVLIKYRKENKNKKILTNDSGIQRVKNSRTKIKKTSI